MSDHGDVSDWTDAREMIDACVDAFGRFDILVNNAGILRDRTLARMTEAEWDDVVRVDLKGHAAPSIHAMAHWRKLAKAHGSRVQGAIVHTSSIAGLMPNFGQGNYAAAKLGIVALSSVLALEGETVGVRSNVVVPSARTQTVLDSMASAGELIEPADETGFDYWDPGNVSPVVGWLASPTCRATGQVLHAVGNEVRLFAPPPHRRPVHHERALDPGRAGTAGRSGTQHVAGRDGIPGRARREGARRWMTRQRRYAGPSTPATSGSWRDCGTSASPRRWTWKRGWRTATSSNATGHRWPPSWPGVAGSGSAAGPFRA
ncbi:SDR family NAD(P)-dependent oxidoreductase [Actinomadura madurae]|nr:SDR family NAD(P)-dependent oxidoreductase [Actinomadura madurae]